MEATESRICISETGTVTFLHDDETMEALSDMGRASIRRVTEINWDFVDQEWKVYKLKNGKTDKVLFSHEKRSVCIQWEKDHHEELM